MSELETMLRASCDLIAKDKEIAALQAIAAELRQTVAQQESQITALQCQLRRATPRWTHASIPALLRPQAG